ncbi:MAG: DUF192 domain-containing protein [Candidatus Aenigmarchaeota archaeon]|nr:DUF192 domain-containing protein [Candidatus Aenigmarchaeota archaeon]
MKGLTERDSLPQDSGMLFVMPTNTKWTFWAKGLKFDVDIIFLNNYGKIVDIQTMRVQPGVVDTDLALYTSHVEAQYVIQINAGRAAESSLANGMTVEFSQ